MNANETNEKSPLQKSIEADMRFNKKIAEKQAIAQFFRKFATVTKKNLEGFHDQTGYKIAQFDEITQSVYMGVIEELQNSINILNSLAGGIDKQTEQEIKACVIMPCGEVPQ